jgi:hypothetical protein
MGKIEKTCATIGAVLCIMIAASKGASQGDLFVMGAMGGGVGAVVGGLLRALIL